MFNNYFYTELKIGDIPNTIEKLIIGNIYNKKITKGIIPYGIKYLKLGLSIYEIDIDTIPNSVTHLIISPEIKINKEYIPDSVVYIKTTDKNLITKNIKYLSLYINNICYEDIQNTNIEYIKIYGDKYIYVK